ncbi:MAG: DUF4962 domain-containing protein, partial [Armatimonadota bacterium]|nr:DUF4962 domain-containing protein [Armatimonadota bacterium]
EGGKGGLGRAVTDSYDGARLGQWQRLQAEFQAPAGIERCWLALETGGNAAVEIDAYLDDVNLTMIDRLSVLDQYRLDPVPAPLASLRGVHPRIYLDAKRVAQLREDVKTTHQALWEEVRALADRAVKQGPPAYRERDTYSGDEQLWQREVGNAMPGLALAYVLTGEQKYLDSARAWALASCAYPTWGLGSTNGMDLAAGHQLFGLGIVYDWCYADLGEEARRTIRETLVKRTSAMFEAAATGKAWWHKSYMQNHLWVNICGMSVAGFVLFDEVPEATLWIGLPLDKFRRTMGFLGPDGASHEGVGYWGYGVEYMLKFMHLARALLGVDLYGEEWWRNTATYRQYLALPRNAWTKNNNIVDIADCPRSNWYGPEYLLRALAHEYRDGYAQWLAGEVDDANVDSPDARWLNLIWFDSAIPKKPPSDRPTLHHFNDMDIVSARTDWSGDESLLVFKCGPFIGHEAIQEFSYDPGGGHVHPDANHFVLFGAGEWLIRDDGYRAKWTGQHNTLLIDERGQLGEGKEWFDGTAALKLKARPRVTRAVSSAQLDHITGDATEAYPRDSGLRRYQRHLLFLKPDVLIVLDDIALDAPRALELRFHPENREATKDGAAFVIKGKQAVLRVEPLTLDGATASAEDVTGQGRHGETGFSMFTVRLAANRAQWRNAVAFSWSKIDGAPTRVTMRSAGDVWTFAAGGRSVSFNWATGAAGL